MEPLNAGGVIDWPAKELLQRYGLGLKRKHRPRPDQFTLSLDADLRAPELDVDQPGRDFPEPCWVKSSPDIGFTQRPEV